MVVSEPMKDELCWWINSLPAICQIRKGSADLVVTSNASLTGWGACRNDICIGGRWSDTECLHHINYLELLAGFLALKICCPFYENISHVQLRLDNSTAIATIWEEQNL